MQENVQTSSTQPSTGNKMSPTMMILVVLVIIVVGFLAMRVLAPSTTIQPDDVIVTEEQTTGSTGEETPATIDEAMMGDVKTIDVTGQSLSFTPKEIRVKKGQKVVINFKAGDMTHDFDIDEFNVDGPVIKAGETTKIEFTPDKAGEFEYYCSVGQHRANGMVGTLIVEE